MSDQRPIDPDSCPGCGHSFSSHFRDVRGIARCIVVHRGETTRGIIGLPWEEHCPCKEFVVPPKAQEKPAELPEAFKRVIHDAFSRAQEACTNYSRPKGIMGGPCLNCGRPQPEHARRERSSI